MNKNEKNKKLGYLEGLRGIAAVIVLLHHLQLAFAQNILNELRFYFEQITDSWLLATVMHAPINLFFNGELSVFIFWVMSAFVVSIKLFDKNSKKYLVQAISKRYFRLAIPVFFSTMFAYSAMKLGLMFNQELLGVVTSNPKAWVLSYYDFEPNFLLAVKAALLDVFINIDGDNYNSVFWTMFPEFLGSIICFIIFATFGRNKYRFHIYLLLGSVTFLLEYYWVITFIIGHTLCDLHYSKNKTQLHSLIQFLFKNIKINLIILFIALIIGGFYNYYAFLYVPTSGLILYLIVKTKPVQGFLQNRFFLWLGEISFSLYLIHIPIIFSFSCYTFLNLPFDQTINAILSSILTIILCLFIAHLFTRYIDKFAIRLANRIGKNISEHFLAK